MFERKNNFVRFHAAQSTVLMGGAFALWAVFQIITHIPILGGLLDFILGWPVSIVLGIVGIVWIILMVLAYRGSTFRIPFVAEYADLLLDRISKRNP